MREELRELREKMLEAIEASNKEISNWRIEQKELLVRHRGGYKEIIRIDLPTRRMAGRL